ncbi:MAG: GNAT family N-acetyltransferase [Acidobacteriota bacterium]|nr:MAG: GNAT family N-acetyltransferase [Acidobacteriota bacterium]
MKGIDTIELTPRNVEQFGIFCVSRHRLPGYRTKVEWFKKQYEKGLRIRLLWSAKRSKSIGFIEYAPIDACWRAVEASGDDGKNFLVIHCIWVSSKQQGAGLGSRLVKEVVGEARRTRRAGVAVVTGSAGWCAHQQLFENAGFRIVDEREPYLLAVRKLQKSSASPKFRSARRSSRKPEGLLLRYSHQCPYLAKCAADLSNEAARLGLDLKTQQIRSSREARNSPTPYGVMSLTDGAELLTSHYASRRRFQNIVRQRGLI